MITTEDWTPDTCKCKLTDKFDYPDDGSPVIPLGYGGTVHRKCEFHKDVPDDELYETLLGNVEDTTFGECRIKNYTLGYLLGRGGVDFGLHEKKKNKDGSDAGEDFKDGMSYQWHFTGKGKDRQLHWEVKGGNLTQEQKKAIKEACDGRFGKDRVIPV